VKKENGREPSKREIRESYVSCRVKGKEREFLADMAADRGITLSEFVRHVVLRSVQYPEYMKAIE